VLIWIWRCVSAVCTWWSTALLSVDTCWLTASVLVLTLDASPPASPPSLTMPRVQTHKIHQTTAATRQTEARKFLANLS